MLNYSPLDETALPILNRFLMHQQYYSCDYTPGVLFMWRKYFSTEYALAGDTLYLRQRYPDGFRYNLYPVGTEDPAVMLSRIEPEADGCIAFAVVPEEVLPVLQSFYGSAVFSSSERAWADYLYPREQLTTCAGKKLAGQRNHINHFLKEYGGYTYESITPDTVSPLRAFLLSNRSALQKEDPLARAEFEYTLDFLNHLPSLNALCGILRLRDGTPCGISVGTVCGDTLYVHIEKALRSIAGAGQLLCREFASHAPEGVAYLNREDDMNDAGLRAAKLALHPCRLVKKYTVIIPHGGSNK